MGGVVGMFAYLYSVEDFDLMIMLTWSYASKEPRYYEWYGALCNATVF